MVNPICTLLFLSVRFVFPHIDVSFELPVLLCLSRLSVGQAPFTSSEKPVTLGEYLKQLSHHRNFMWFASMNLVQVI